MTRIDIIKSDEGVNVSVIGHARGESGNNVLCAAVSMVSQLLEQTVSDLAANGELRYGNAEKSDGKMIIRIVPDSRFESDVMRCINVVLRGFDMLAEKYPEDFRIFSNL